MKRVDILSLKTRRQIYNYLLTYPGLHLRELCRKLNMPKSTLDYHLTYLEKKGLIISKPEKYYTRYYVKEQVSTGDKELIKLFRQEIPRIIILLLLVAGPAEIYKTRDSYFKARANHFTRVRLRSIKELVGMTKYWKITKDDPIHLKIKRSAITYHLNKLLEADIIEKIQVGKEMKYKLKNEDDVLVFILAKGDIISDITVDRLLANEEKLLGKNSDAIVDTIFEIFPHPYHA